MSVLLEVCVDSPEGLDAAIASGADRIELCSALELGGLTPTPGLIARAAEAPVPVYAMIRPRPGNFVFSQSDIDAMLHEVSVIREAGLAGVVLGASLADGRLDRVTLGKLVARSRGLGTTLHRAFDLVPDLEEAVATAIDLGFERILTSGRANTAIEGAGDLARIVELASGRITIMPGSGINVGNAAALLDRIAFTEIHSSCAAPLQSMNERAIRLGFEHVAQKQTSLELVRAFKAFCQNFPVRSYPSK